MSERLDRIETEIDRMLAVQRELQESQLRQQENQLRLEENQLRLEENQLRQGEQLDRLIETTGRNSQAIASLVTVVTAHQDSMEQLKRAVDYLLSKDGDA